MPAREDTWHRSDRVVRHRAAVRTSMKRLISCGAIAVGILAGCGAAASSVVPTQGSGSPALSASAAPSPSTAPSAGPSATAVYPAWYSGEREGAGILPAGSQTTRTFLAGSTFTVPEGWVNEGDTAAFYSLFPDTPANAAEYAASGQMAESVLVAPIESPYFVCEAWEDNRGTAAEMVAAMVANEALATSEPIDVTVGGLTGKQIDVQLDPGWTDTCPADPPSFDLADTRARTVLLDTPDGRVLVILLVSLHAAGHEVFLAEAMPIIESFQFEIAQ